LAGHKIEEKVEANLQKMKIGDIVPFGQAAVVNEEGCTGNLRPEC